MSDTMPSREGWVLELRGSEPLLWDLVSSYRQGDLRVFERETRYYLEADTIDTQPDFLSAEREGTALLRTMLGRARTSGALGRATPAAVIRRAADGTWGQRFALVRASLGWAWGMSCAIPVEGPTWPERVLALARRDRRVRAALDDFAGELDLPRLPRVYETMWTEFDPKKQGEAERQIVERGLSTKTELDRFGNTVNRSSEEAAHSPFKYKPYPNAMPLEEARRYLGGLLARWIDAKL